MDITATIEINGHMSDANTVAAGKKQQIAGFPSLRIRAVDISPGKCLLRGVAPQYQAGRPIGRLYQTGAVRAFRCKSAPYVWSSDHRFWVDNIVVMSDSFDAHVSKSSTLLLSTYP